MSRDLFSLYERHIPRQTAELQVYWRRLGGRPALQDKRVLDFGSSIGVGCFDALEQGAAAVVGVEIDPNLLAFSRHRLERDYPKYAGRLTLTDQPIAALEGAPFDFILSKDVFEHVQSDGGLAKVLQDMHDKLVPGGLAYLGWGPLYYSPRGGHGLCRFKLGSRDVEVPWGHLLLPEPLLIHLYNRMYGEHYASISDYGLNKLRYAEYERVVHASPFEVLSYRVNVTDNPLRAAVDGLLKVAPVLRDYLTSTIYCVLRRRTAS